MSAGSLILSYAPPLIIVAGLVILGVIIGRKFPALSNLSPEAMPGFKEAVVKSDLIEQRLRRKFTNFGQLVAGALVPLWHKLQQSFRILKHRVDLVEQQYRQQTRAQAPGLPALAVREKSLVLLNEAKALVDEKKFPEAEKKYIELITLDNANIEAWRLLAELYTEIKNYKDAITALEYAIKLCKKKTQELAVPLTSSTFASEVAANYIDLGLVFFNQGDFRRALKRFKEAVAIESLNPKNLDLLLETSIRVGDRVLAWSTYGKLKEANPENQKLSEFEARITELEKKRPLKKR